MMLERYENNPILAANRRNDWESLCTLNPAVLYEEGVFYLYYRAAGNDDAHTITLGLATSTDGRRFERFSDSPVLAPDPNGPDAGGCEDPRIVKMGGLYYLTYASRTFLPGRYWEKSPTDPNEYGFLAPEGPSFLNKNTTLTHLAVSRDRVNFKKLGRMTDSRVDNRDVILFPEKCNGRYVMISRPMDWHGDAYGCKMPSIWISYSDDLLEWDNCQLMATGEQPWESKKIGGSTPPIKSEKGWVLLYHGVSVQDNAYRVGAMLLDLNNPTNILARTRDYLMEPVEAYETEGYYNGCVFPCGNVVVEDVLHVYYGAADKYCCLATCSFSGLVDHLDQQCRRSDR